MFREEIESKKLNQEGQKVPVLKPPLLGDRVIDWYKTVTASAKTDDMISAEACRLVGQSFIRK